MSDCSNNFLILIELLKKIIYAIRMTVKTVYKVRLALDYSPAQMAKALGLPRNSYLYLEEKGQSTRNDVQARLKKLYMTTKGATHEKFDRWMEEDGENVLVEGRGRKSETKDIETVSLGKAKK